MMRAKNVETAAAKVAWSLAVNRPTCPEVSSPGIWMRSWQRWISRPMA